MSTPEAGAREAALIQAIADAKARRMKAQIAGDMETVSALQTRVRELTAQVWRVRTREEKL